MASKAGAKLKAVVETVDQDTGEVIGSSSSLNIKEGFKLKKVITVPQLKFGAVGSALHVEFVSVFSESKVAPKPGEKPAIVADVINLDDERQYKLIVPAVVMKNLEDNYPSGDYVGKRFYLEKLGKRKADQRYIDYGIAEIEPD